MRHDTVSEVSSPFPLHRRYSGDFPDTPKNEVGSRDRHISGTMNFNLTVARRRKLLARSEDAVPAEAQRSVSSRLALRAGVNELHRSPSPSVL